MSVVVQPWLISKFFDPVFAVAVGFSAAALRIRREQTERFPQNDNSYGALWHRTIENSKAYFGTKS